MRVAALYDIHANLPAREAVLEEIAVLRLDRLVIGGDVLPGPMPRETLDALARLSLPVEFIRGNGDRAVLEQMSGTESEGLPVPAREAVRWVAEQLTDEDRLALERWLPTLRLNIPKLGEVLFCHATPRSDTEIFTRATPDERLMPVFAGLGDRVVVCGHTHMPFDRMIDKTRVLNGGSVGMPFGSPAASWLLLGPGVEFRRTEYDLNAAAARVRATAYPQAEEFASRDVLHPRSEKDALALFAKAESGAHS